MARCIGTLVFDRRTALLEVLPIFLDALSFVLILMLVASGLVIVFGMMGIINLAHGELFLLGAYTVVVAQGFGAPFWLAAALAPLVVGMVGLAIEILLVRFVVHRPLDTILATWGLSIAIKQIVVLAFGPGSHSVVVPIDGAITVGAFTYPAYRIVLMIVATAVIAGAGYVLVHTRMGLLARAVIARPDTSASLGINTGRVTQVSFAVGAALAGLSGALVAPLISVDPQMGLGFLFPAFLASLVGGAGSMSGLVAGGGLVGSMDSLLSGWVSPVLAQITVFVLAILVIRLRPGGLFPSRGRGHE
jgi:urea ABC transporter permease protein UrtB